MLSNIELESKIKELVEEVRVLKESLDKAFHSSGLGTEWAQSKPSRPIVESTSHEVAPPIKPTYNAAELGALMREFFPNGAPTLTDIQELLSKE